MLDGKRILVTGATGFIGRSLCEKLVSGGARVIGMARGGSAALRGCCEILLADILNASDVGKIVAELAPEVVIHLAATRNRGVDFAAFRSGYEVNLLGTLNVMEACVNSAGTRLVHLGTCEEYGSAAVPFDEMGREAPASAYGISKLGATQLLQAAARNWNLPVVILRPTNVYGPGQAEDMFLPALIAALVRGRPFSMTPGEQTRDYVYLDDLVEAILCAVSKPTPAGSVVNIGAGQPVRMKEVASLAVRSVGPSAQGLLSFDKAYRPGESMEYWASTERASRLFGWQPRVALEKGIEHTVSSIRAAIQRG